MSPLRCYPDIHDPTRTTPEPPGRQRIRAQMEARAAVLRLAEEAREMAGYIAHRWDPLAGVMTVLVDAEEQGAGGGRATGETYAVICMAHGGLLTETNKRVLRRQLGYAHDWCPDCRGEVRDPYAPAAGRFEEREQAPGCPHRYLATGETVGMLWDLREGTWVCPESAAEVTS